MFSKAAASLFPELWARGEAPAVKLSALGFGLWSPRLPHNGSWEKGKHRGSSSEKSA